MRTLVFCTAHAAAHSVWETRYRLWLEGVAALRADLVLMVDDGSATLPGWPDFYLYSGDSIAEAFTVGARLPRMMFHFREHLGRADVLNFPGWHRSFVFALLFAEANGFARVIHVESDAFLLSDRARRFVATFSDGWAALYAPRLDVPESAVQVAAGSGLGVMAAFARRSYAALVGRSHEREMPFTHVERGLAGDRIGEIAGAVPPGLDYAAQVPARREAGFYHWLPGRAQPAPNRSVTLRLCAGGDGLAALRSGWADPERTHHWMLDGESTLELPPMSGPGPAVLRMGVTPHVFGDVLTRQHLRLEVNGHFVRAFDIMLECVLGCDIPGSVLGDRNELRLVHPDAVAPCVFGGSDRRRLSVSVEWLTLEHFQPDWNRKTETAAFG
jgi:hypothetical protein